MYVYVYDGMELNITKNEAAKGSHQGSCDADIADLMTVPRIRRQLNKLNPVKLAGALKEYGAWDDVELSDHEQNKARILWIVCGNIVEDNC